MENNVVTLETAKKLKVAGFPQHSAYGWGYSQDAPAAAPELEGKITWYLAEGTGFGAIAAPTAQEIMDELISNRYSSDLKFRPFNAADKSWMLEAESQFSLYYIEDDNNIAELLAGAWLKLHETKGGAER